MEVQGLEPDATAAETAEQSGVPVVRRLLDQAVRAESFDAITMNHVIEHLHDPVDAPRICHELVSPQGVLWIATPNLGSRDTSSTAGTDRARPAAPPRALHAISAGRSGHERRSEPERFASTTWPTAAPSKRCGRCGRKPAGQKGSWRSTTCGAAAPSSTSRGCARRGSRSCMATCGRPRTSPPSAGSTCSSSARPSRRCWPASRATSSARTCSAPTTAWSSRAAPALSSSSSRPAASIRWPGSRRLALREAETRFELEPSSRCRAPRAPASPRTSRSTARARSTARRSSPPSS